MASLGGQSESQFSPAAPWEKFSFLTHAAAREAPGMLPRQPRRNGGGRKGRQRKKKEEAEAAAVGRGKSGLRDRGEKKLNGRGSRRVSGKEDEED